MLMKISNTDVNSFLNRDISFSDISKQALFAGKPDIQPRDLTSVLKKQQVFILSLFYRAHFSNISILKKLWLLERFYSVL